MQARWCYVDIYVRRKCLIASNKCQTTEGVLDLHWGEPVEMIKGCSIGDEGSTATRPRPGPNPINTSTDVIVYANYAMRSNDRH